LAKIEFAYATQRDFSKIVETYNSTIPSRLVTADLEPVSLKDKLEWFNAHDPNRRPLWVITSDGDYAGWMSFNSFYGRPAYAGTVEISIYLNELYRGKGIGKHCLEKAQKEAPELKIHTLLGFIFGHNTGSLALFEKDGFTKWAHLPGVAVMDGVPRDLIILGKKIDGSHKS